MVLILDGNIEIPAPEAVSVIWSVQSILKDQFSLMRAQNVLSYHLIYVYHDTILLKDPGGFE